VGNGKIKNIQGNRKTRSNKKNYSKNTVQKRGQFKKSISFFEAIKRAYLAALEKIS